MMITPFTGIPRYRSTAQPPVRAVLVGDTLRVPRSGLDWLLFGVVNRVAGGSIL